MHDPIDSGRFFRIHRFMAELTQSEVVFSSRSLQLWKTLVNCLAFCNQIFLQILRAVGYHPLLSSSAKSTTDGFKPLPNIELLETAAADTPTSVEIDSSSEGERSRFQRLKVVFKQLLPKLRSRLHILLSLGLFSWMSPSWLRIG